VAGGLGKSDAVKDEEGTSSLEDARAGVGEDGSIGKQTGWAIRHVVTTREIRSGAQVPVAVL